MEFPLESILHTVLLGLLACLVIYPYSLRYLERIDRPSSKSTQFAWLQTGFLAAIVYSLGICLEFGADRFWLYFTDEARVSGYEIVFGKTTPIVVRSESGVVVEQFGESKVVLHDDRLRVFYRAKNVAFLSDNYFAELRDLERRIRFISGVILTLGLWCVLIAASLFHKSLEPGLSVKTVPGKLLTIVLGVLLSGALFATLRHESYNYTLRVYGYYFDSETYSMDVQKSRSANKQMQPTQ